MQSQPQFRSLNETSSSAPAQLQQRLLDFGEILSNHNISAITTNDEMLAHFAKLDPQFQQQILGRFQHYLSIIADITDNGIKLNDTYQSLWRIFKKMGWLFDSDLLSRIKSTNVVEIYLSDNTQFYRNLNYFRYTSYSLPELLFFPWHELVEHGPTYEQEIGEVAKEIFLKNAAPGTTFKLTPYIAKERRSKKRYEALLTSEFICPIRGRTSGQNEAALVVWDIEILKSIDNRSNLTGHSENNEKTI